VSHYNGAFERAFETEVAGVRLRAPMMLIHTVAAGGGSILHFDGARYRVGPDSAGAHPGPACYRNGGPLAITDCNVMLGKLQGDLFPQVFGEGADQSLDAGVVKAKFVELAARIEADTGDARAPEEVAAGFLAIAVENMANAIKKISVQRGYDVSEYALCCFGGAGGQHACLVADALAMKRILIHPYAGVLSAYGMGLADTVVERQCAVEATLSPTLLTDLAAQFDALRQEGIDELVSQGIDCGGEKPADLRSASLAGASVDSRSTDCGNDGGEDFCGNEGDGGNDNGNDRNDGNDDDRNDDNDDNDDDRNDDNDDRNDSNNDSPSMIEVRRWLHIRYHGSDTALRVGHGGLDEVQGEFEKLHRMRFGFVSPEKALVVESIEVEVIKAAEPSTIVHRVNRVAGDADAVRRCYMDGRWRDAPFYHRATLAADAPVDGPAVILDPTSAIAVEPGWRACLRDDNNLVLERYRARAAVAAVGVSDDAVDPVMLEIFNNLFMSIAEQMGSVLENTAASVNIKERLDFSCAIFDRRGALVANAPHMPVHLGSMGESIKTVIRERGDDIRAGDAYILNAPYNGGTHLPDVTIIKPVFAKSVVASRARDRLLFYVASRGHHADIGGTTPGSAPADSRSIEEEGVVIDNVKLVEDDRFREREIHQLLTAGKWPARNPKMNIADFKAQLAACEKGARELIAMAAHYGVDTVHAYMRHVQDNAEESVRRVLEVLSDGAFAYAMDDGSRIQVSIRVERAKRRATVDFTGTSAQHAGNFNAPSAVVRAAVLYVFRCLVDDDIPLNEGCLKPMDIIIPPRSMISPRHPAAVIAGNVETSQYLVDTLFGALQAVAAAQGTMNNFIWGNDAHQYYETICGGAGASAQADGADAV
ncbi:MAG: hydantoinase B/oxoprolinase family protein, partial [bacterium]